MNKKQVEKWCEENKYALVDLNHNGLTSDFVFKVAQEATYVNEIKKSSRKHELAFARFLAISYLDDKMATGVISSKLGLSHCIITYAREQNILTGDTKYFKKWQQHSIEYFKRVIKEAEDKLCKS